MVVRFGLAVQFKKYPEYKEALGQALRFGLGFPAVRIFFSP
jgi:hypothetical protein